MSEIKTVAVCGAGVMGSQLAALFAGAGLRVYLFDLEQELAERGLAGARKARPAAFYHRRFAKNVVPSNYEEHLDRIGENGGHVVVDLEVNVYPCREARLAQLHHFLHQGSVFPECLDNAFINGIGEDLWPDPNKEKAG